MNILEVAVKNIIDGMVENIFSNFYGQHALEITGPIHINKYRKYISNNTYYLNLNTSYGVLYLGLIVVCEPDLYTLTLMLYIS